MSHPEQPRSDRPPGRTDPTRPPRPTSRAAHRHLTGRGTQPSTARPGARRASRPHTTGQRPTPASVWTFGATAIDPDARWPTPVLATIVTSFTDPGAHVVLLADPTPAPHHGSTDRCGSDPDGELATALATIHGLHRAPRVLRLPPPGPAPYPDPSPGHTTQHGASARPLGGPQTVGPTRSAAHPASLSTVPADPPADTSAAADADAGADLVIASLTPDHTTTRTSELVALTAARLLRSGGILAALTHSDWMGGRLRDPTGPVVTAGQNADLLYLQHIVAVHAPLRDGRFAITSDLADPAADDHAQPRTSPVAHRRLHSDLTVLMQLRNHHPAPPTGAVVAPIRR